MGHGLTSNKWHQRFLADTWSILYTLIRPLQRCFSHPACLRGMNLNSNNTAWSPTNKSSKNGHQITSQTNMINGSKHSQPAKYCLTFYIYSLSQSSGSSSNITKQSNVPYWAMSSAMLCLRAQVIPTTRTQKFPGEDRRTAAHSSSCCASTSLVTVTNGPRAQTCEEPQS